MKHFFILLLFLPNGAWGWTVVAENIRGWDTKTLSINVNATDCSISESQLNASIDRAIALWNSVPNAGTKLTRGSSTTDVSTFTGGSAIDTPVIICDPNFSTTLNVSADAIPGAVTNILGNPNIYYAGMLLNSESGGAADIAELDELSLDIVIAHEMGHLLGLGHASQERSLMYFSITGKSELLLTEDDMDGFTYLYPSIGFDSPFGCASTHRGDFEGKKFSWGVFLIAVLLLVNFIVGRFLLQYRFFILLLCFSPLLAYGKYRRPEIKMIPVKRLVANLETKAKKSQKSPLPHYALARFHAMIYFTQKEKFEAVPERRVGGKQKRIYVPWYGFHAKRVPAFKKWEAPKKKDRSHLKLAIENYRISLKRNDKFLAAMLGLGWALEQDGQIEKAKKWYREVFDRGWKVERKMADGFGPNWSVALEAGEYLKKLLDRSKEAKALKELEHRMATLERIPRKISPIFVPLTKEIRFEKLVDLNANVKFDMDGSGRVRQWQWLRSSAGWLVYQHEPEESIQSGAQLFGNFSFRVFWENGYEALAALDDSQDGKLTGKELKGLSIWRDANGDGVHDFGEVKPLKQWGVRELNLNYSASPSGWTSARGVVFQDGRTAPSFDWVVSMSKSRD